MNAGMTTTPRLLPRAKLTDVLRGRGAIVGSRLDESGRRGMVSPIEARLHMGILYDDAVSAEREALARPAETKPMRVLTKVLVAKMLGGSAPASVEPRPLVVSARVDNVTIEGAVEKILEAPSGRARFIAFVHPHALNLAAFDRELRGIIESADAVLPDGIGVRIAARLNRTPLSANVNGTDLLPRIASEAARQRIPLVLVGAKPGVAEDCSDTLRASHPGLEIPIVSDGYLDEAKEKALLDRLRKAGHVVVLVAMGTPLQERWIAKVRDQVPNATFIGVGGLFDFFSGRVPRAPLFVRELGLEWAFRMAQEPRRLAKRYILGNPLFLLLAMGQRIRGRR